MIAWEWLTIRKDWRRKLSPPDVSHCPGLCLRLEASAQLRRRWGHSLTQHMFSACIQPLMGPAWVERSLRLRSDYLLFANFNPWTQQQSLANPAFPELQRNYCNSFWKFKGKKCDNSLLLYLEGLSTIKIDWKYHTGRVGIAVTL
jgi:hypothetical protein